MKPCPCQPNHCDPAHHSPGGVAEKTWPFRPGKTRRDRVKRLKRSTVTGGTVGTERA